MNVNKTKNLKSVNIFQFLLIDRRYSAIKNKATKKPV